MCEPRLVYYYHVIRCCSHCRRRVVTSGHSLAGIVKNRFKDRRFLQLDVNSSSWSNELLVFFFFNDTATTEIYTLSLHDALPISSARRHAHYGERSRQSQRDADRASLSGDGLQVARDRRNGEVPACARHSCDPGPQRSEEHTSELQSLTNLVCRLLLQKKKMSLRLMPRASPHGPLHPESSRARQVLPLVRGVLLEAHFAAVDPVAPQTGVCGRGACAV